MNPITVFLTILLLLIALGFWLAGSPLPGTAFGVLAVLIATSLKMANNWQRFVILRAGKLHGVKGPGLFLIMPIVDAVDRGHRRADPNHRVQCRTGAHQRHGPGQRRRGDLLACPRRSEGRTQYHQLSEAIDRVAQTSLREMIGASLLAPVCPERQAADLHAARRDRSQDRELGNLGQCGGNPRRRHSRSAARLAMSRQAQAEREKQARVILGAAEAKIDQKFVDAANLYNQNPAALQSGHEHHLRNHQRTRHHRVASIPTRPGRQHEYGAAIGLRPRRDRGSAPPRTVAARHFTVERGAAITRAAVVRATGCRLFLCGRRWVDRSKRGEHRVGPDPRA